MPFTGRRHDADRGRYVGEDVQNIIMKLRSRHYNVERAQRGIVYIDGRHDSPQSDHPSITREVGEGVQQALSRHEGTVASRAAAGRAQASPAGVPQVARPNLLICGGAFSGLDKKSRWPQCTSTASAPRWWAEARRTGEGLRDSSRKIS